MTESDVKNQADKMTWKWYSILKQIHSEEYALESVKIAPYFINNIK